MRLLLALALCFPAFAAINVTASHPNRLVMDATRLTRVQAKIGTQEWTDFVNYYTSNYTAATTSSWADYVTATAMDAAIICRATGSYCDQAVTLFMRSATVGAHGSWVTTSFDPATGYLIDPVNMYAPSTTVLAGIDFPISFWSFYGTGVLPTGLSYGTQYWIRWHHQDSTHSYWTIATTAGGTPLSFTGTGSGQVLVESIWRLSGGIGGSNAPRTYLGQMAVIYDWLYSSLNSTQKLYWYQQLKAALQFVVAIDYVGGGKLLNNVWVGDHRGGALYGIAIIGDDGTDTANVQTLLNQIDSDFTTELTANGSLLTGGFIEGTEYSAEQQSCLWEFFDAIYTSTGRTDNRFTALQPYYQGMVDYYQHAFSPGTFTSSSVSYRDLVAHGEILKSGLWGTVIGGMKRLPPASTHRKTLQFLLECMGILTDSTRASYVQQMLTNYAPTTALKDTTTYLKQIQYPYEIIFTNPAVTAAAWTSAPLFKSLAGTNEVFAKSDWTSTATSVGIWGSLTRTNTSTIDHIRSEGGAFHFYRKGTLLAGNWWAYPYDTSNNLNYLLNLYPGTGIWPSSYNSILVGAAPTWNNVISGISQSDWSLLAAENVGTRSYAKLDGTGAFRNWWGTVPPQGWGNTSYIASSVVREWLYVAPDVLVIHDKITKSVATPASQWNLQAQGHTATVSSNVMTIDTGSQKLNATVVLPTSPQIALKRSDRPYVQWVSRSATPVLTLEANITVTVGTSTTVTLSGATGSWAVLNGTWNVVPIDKRNLQITAGQVSTAGIATPFGGQAMVLNGHGSTAPYNDLITAFNGDPALTGGNYFEVMGSESTADNFLVALEAIDSGGTPSTVTKLTATNLEAAQIGNIVTGFVPGSTVTLPITYSHGASGRHYIAGLAANTAYMVDTGTTGAVTISASGSGTSMTTSGAGILTYYTGAVPLAVDTTSLPGGLIGVPYSASLTAVGGTSPYTWAITSGTLCSGLSLVGSTITGTPTVSGVCSFTVRATDSVAATASQALTISISTPAPPSPGRQAGGRIVAGGRLQ